MILCIIFDSSNLSTLSVIYMYFQDHKRRTRDYRVPLCMVTPRVTRSLILLCLQSCPVSHPSLSHRGTPTLPSSLTESPLKLFSTRGVTSYCSESRYKVPVFPSYRITFSTLRLLFLVERSNPRDTGTGSVRGKIASIRGHK